MRTILAVVLSLLIPWGWSAAQTVDPEAVPKPPPLPSPEERARAQKDAEAREATAAEPAPEIKEQPPADEVIERVEGDQTITEYRRRGQLYMVKMKPKRGPAQYWMDRDGDGQFEREGGDIDEDVNLPKWRIGNW